LTREALAVAHREALAVGPREALAVAHREALAVGPAGHRQAPAPAGHRERLIAAMAESIEEKGYRETFVGDVVRLARTSRRSFYEQFADREACFLALFDAAHEEVIERVTASVSPEAPWEQQADDAVAAWLSAMLAHPRLWWSFTRELPALGADGAARQRAALERFAHVLVALVDTGRRRQPELGARPLTMDQAIIIVGGLRELVITATEQGRDVRELGPIAAQTIMAILGATVLRS
jgi:AcrR family transcriptional regulator